MNQAVPFINAEGGGGGTGLGRGSSSLLFDRLDRRSGDGGDLVLPHQWDADRDYEENDFDRCCPCVNWGPPSRWLPWQIWEILRGRAGVFTAGMERFQLFSFRENLKEKRKLS